MLSFRQLLTLAACAVVTLATSDAILAHCDGASLLNDTPIEVNGKIVSFKEFSCAPSKVSSRTTVKRDPLNVCGTLCSNSCNLNAGSLPPIIDDCTQIKDAIIIFSGQTSPTFVVRPNNLQALTFGTCTFFFKNTGQQDLDYCWSGLSATASSAASACFPPVMPISSEGLCTASNGAWAVGAAHS